MVCQPQLKESNHEWIEIGVSSKLALNVDVWGSVGHPIRLNFDGQVTCR